MAVIGSRVQVWHGTAHHTSGGLTRKDIKMNKWGRLVSVKKSRVAKTERRLEKAGYFAEKGKFGAVRRDGSPVRSSSRSSSRSASRSSSRSPSRAAAGGSRRR